MTPDERWPLFPLFLKLDRARCVVVGRSAEARRKCASLLDCGALVDLYAPGERPDWAELTDEQLSRVQHIDRWPQSADLTGARLVIAAAAIPELDHRLAAACRSQGILINVVDVIPLCDVYMPGVIRRGPVSVAIGTSGTSPALVGALRERIDAVLPSGLALLAQRFGELRPLLKQRFPDFADRARRMGNATRILLNQLDRGLSLVDLGQQIDRALRCNETCDNREQCCLQRPFGS